MYLFGGSPEPETKPTTVTIITAATPPPVRRVAPLGMHRHWLVLLGAVVGCLTILGAAAATTTGGITGAWQALASSGLYPPGVTPTVNPTATPQTGDLASKQSIDCINRARGYRDLDAICVTADGMHHFICAALPWARLAEQYETSTWDHIPGPHDLGPQYALPHPWYISVLLAQWSIEQGMQVPNGLDGYNWGNSSGIPGFDAVGGTGQPGSPNTFAYAHNPLQGIEIHTTFTKMDFYIGVWQAYPRGPIAQAYALGYSPWDAAHYTPDGHPGDSLVWRINRFHLTQYDAPGATC